MQVYDYVTNHISKKLLYQSWYLWLSFLINKELGHELMEMFPYNLSGEYIIIFKCLFTTKNIFKITHTKAEKVVTYYQNVANLTNFSRIWCPIPITKPGVSALEIWGISYAYRKASNPSCAKHLLKKTSFLDTLGAAAPQWSRDRKNSGKTNNFSGKH